MTATPPNATTTTTTATQESPSAAASRYQQLRSHLAELKLTAAAEALPAVLDQATAEGLSPNEDRRPASALTSAAGAGGYSRIYRGRDC